MPWLIFRMVHQWRPIWKSVSRRWGLWLWDNHAMALRSFVLEIYRWALMGYEAVPVPEFLMQIQSCFSPPHSHSPFCVNPSLGGFCWVYGCWDCCAQFPLPRSNRNRCLLEKWIETSNMTWVIKLLWWIPELNIVTPGSHSLSFVWLFISFGLSCNRVPSSSRDCSWALRASTLHIPGKWYMWGRVAACWHTALLLFLLTPWTACLFNSHPSNTSKHLRS